MINRREMQALKSRPDDNTESPLDFCEDDYDSSLDEFMDEDFATDDRRFDHADYVPSWRLIKMRFEDIYMKTILADFDEDGEYDEIEYFGEDMPAEYSH
jgi:hypothetical protein